MHVLKCSIYMRFASWFWNLATEMLSVKKLTWMFVCWDPLEAARRWCCCWWPHPCLFQVRGPIPLWWSYIGPSVVWGWAVSGSPCNDGLRVLVDRAENWAAPWHTTSVRAACLLLFFLKYLPYMQHASSRWDIFLRGLVENSREKGKHFRRESKRYQTWPA